MRGRHLFTSACAPLLLVGVVSLSGCGSADKASTTGPSSTVSAGFAPSSTAVTAPGGTIEKSPNCLKVETFKFIVYAVDLEPTNTKDNLDTQLITTGDALAGVAPELRKEINTVIADRLAKLGKPVPALELSSSSAQESYDKVDGFYRANCPPSVTGAPAAAR